MTVLVVIPPSILSVAPFLAQTNGSDAAVAGIAGLISMLGVFGFFVAFIYSIVLFFLPFMVWKCLRRLTSIRDDVRGMRQELIAATRQRTSTAPAALQRMATLPVAPSLPVPPAAQPNWMSQDIKDIKPIMRDYEEK
jgi:hypothetical protein